MKTKLPVYQDILFYTVTIANTVWRKILTVENFDESGLGKF